MGITVYGKYATVVDIHGTPIINSLTLRGDYVTGGTPGNGSTIINASLDAVPGTITLLSSPVLLANGVQLTTGNPALLQMGGLMPLQVLSSIDATIENLLANGIRLGTNDAIVWVDGSTVKVTTIESQLWSANGATAKGTVNVFVVVPDAGRLDLGGLNPSEVQGIMNVLLSTGTATLVFEEDTIGFELGKIEDRIKIRMQPPNFTILIK